ncbi:MULTISPECIES: DUF397 domain-containing protein [Streptomyces]|uniref:DUF397 domain-containing protein n=1 Tax=Streptomyces lonegramiae TaxID=3075524 RepID=A0ABU2XMB6_9ACTN|nr:DUF397 domain-containing protein [Streptomyces sp. DSM 41529]MDT0546614.1 DUF397 domain-containing protein [Streptomyces sp. DSM 41529]
MAEHTIPDAGRLSGWRKSSYSGNNADSCIEILDGYPSGVPVRDSKTPHSPMLVFPADSWSSFLAALKNGYFVT